MCIRDRCEDARASVAAFGVDVRAFEREEGRLGGFSRDEIDDEIGAQESICVADAGEENIEDTKTHCSSRGIDRET